MDYFDELAANIKRVQQSKFCLDMLKRIHEHISEPREDGSSKKDGYTRSQILADIRHLRRELLQLSRMI